MKKNLLLFVVIIFVQHFCFGQTSNWLWARQATGAGTQEGISSTTDKSGNVYATGDFNSSVTFGSITLIGQGNMFLVKYSPTGSVIWANSAGGSSFDIGCSVATDESDNVYVTGYFRSSTLIFGSDTLFNTGSSNMFIVKYSSTGTLLWAKSGEGNSSVVGNSVTVNSLGNVCVTGNFDTTGYVIFGNDTLTSIGNINIFIVEYSTSGAILWAKGAGGPGRSSSNYIASDVFGNIYITGYFIDSITFGSTTTLTNIGFNGADIFVAKYSDTGSFIWGKSAKGTGIGTCIATDVIGNVYLTGYFIQSPILIFDSDTLINSGSYDMYIVKYSASGTVLSAKAVGGTDSEIGHGLVTDLSGNVYVTGLFSSPFILFDSDTLYLPGAGLHDPMFLVKYDSLLNVICTTALTSGGDDWSGLSTDGNDNLYIAGDFYYNSLIIGTDTLSGTGTETFFIAKYNCQTGLAVNELPNQEAISIYPNPISNEFAIRSTENEIKEIKILDVLGKEIKTIYYSGKQLTINKGEINSGIYIVQITDEKKNVVNKKIIIQ